MVLRIINFSQNNSNYFAIPVSIGERSASSSSLGIARKPDEEPGGGGGVVSRCVCYHFAAISKEGPNRYNRTGFCALADHTTAVHFNRGKRQTTTVNPFRTAVPFWGQTT